MGHLPSSLAKIPTVVAANHFLSSDLVHHGERIGATVCDER